MEECPFAVLGLDPTASTDHVREAFRRLALQLHPDKAHAHGSGHAGAREHRSSAEFHRVHVAYRRILEDHRQHGCFGCVDDRRPNSPSMPSQEGESSSRLVQRLPALVVQLLFAMMWMAREAAAMRTFACARSQSSDRDGGHEDPPPQQQARRGEKRDVSIRIEVSLADAHACRVKKVVYWVERRGRRTRAVVYVPLGPWRGGAYSFQGMGDEWGDAVVDVTVLDDHPVLSVTGVLNDVDMHAEVRITPFEHYYGTTVEVDVFGESTTVTLPQETSTGRGDRNISTTVVLPGMGMPRPGAEAAARRREPGARGDIYVYFMVSMPALDAAFLSRPDVRAALAHAFVAPPEDRSRPASPVAPC